MLKKKEGGCGRRCGQDHVVSEEARRAPEEFVAEDVPENHVVSEDVGMLTGVTEFGMKEEFAAQLTLAAEQTHLPHPGRLYKKSIWKRL